LLPEINVGTVDKPGLHAGTYLSVIKNIENDSRIKMLIITMNLRSFGANWRYSKAENHLAKSELMLSTSPPLINKFLISLKAYDHKTDEERVAQFKDAWEKETFNISNFKYTNVNSWDSAMAWQEWLSTNPYLTETNISLACHYIKNFAFSIDTLSNSRIQDFDEIIEIANERKYTVVFNLLSENMEEAKNLVGKELIYLIQHNRELLIQHYESKGAVVVDNLYVVPDSCFVDRDWPTEHYSKDGKKRIAENINRIIREKDLIQNINSVVTSSNTEK